jgi:hypothetical protein
MDMTVSGIRLDPDGGDVLNTLRMTDISRSGMGAITAQPLYPGQRLLLCLPLRDIGGRRNIYATVVRRHSRREGYRVGLRFDLGSDAGWYGLAGPMTAAA